MQQQHRPSFYFNDQNEEVAAYWAKVWQSGGGGTSHPSSFILSSSSAPHHPRGLLHQHDYHHPHAAHQGDITTVVLGWLLLIAAYCMFVAVLYACCASYFVPFTGNKLLDAVKRDHYYSYLIPLTVPVTMICVIANWLGMKFFRHN